MLGSKTLFAGVSESDRPGSIYVLRNPWEKLYEIQAHSQAVERLRLSYDNQFLFSAGRDGVFCIFDIKDKDGILIHKFTLLVKVTDLDD